jgi:putative peptidoglycan lipid II flippase
VSEAFSAVTSFVLLLLGALIICTTFTVKYWLPLLFSGFAANTTAIAERLTFLIFPAILFLGLSGILAATLNAFQRFSLPAFAPAISSMAVMVAAWFARGEHAIYIVGFASTLGFLLQFLLLTPATVSLGIRFRPSLNFRHPAIARMIRLGGPLFMYLVVANASLLIERNLASKLSAGAVSALTYALRVFTVPANFLAAPLAIVAYPQFAREALRSDHGELRVQLSQTLRFVFFLFLPATVWTIMNSLLIIRALYERGQFGPEDSFVISRVLTLYGIGILPNAIAVILLRCFYAIQDTVTPLVAESIDLAFYLVTAPLLMRHFGIVGLAITRGMTFFVVAGILGFALHRRRQLLNIDSAALRFCGRTAIACLAMVILNSALLYFLTPIFDSGATLLRLGVILLLLLAGGATFLGVALWLNLNEARRILSTVLDFLPGRVADPRHAGS